MNWKPIDEFNAEFIMPDDSILLYEIGDVCPLGIDDQPPGKDDVWYVEE